MLVRLLDSSAGCQVILQSLSNMYKNITDIISSPRMESFRRNGDDDLETLTRCLWNTQLCESFYPSLQHLEIGLRNSIHNALTFSYRNVRWYKESFICGMCMEDVKYAENALIAAGKDPTDPGRVIAELSFGFWTRLFSSTYQRTLWNNKTFLLRAFPNATAQQRTRNALAAKVDTIRRFRNRVFHHESIISHKLPEIHRSILETTEWINKDLAMLNNAIDRFDTVVSENHYNELKTVVQNLL